MRKFLRTTKALLVAAGLCVGANTAWADSTLGSTTTGWGDASTSAITLAANKTLTLNFTVTESAGADYQGHVIILAKGNANTWGANQYLFLRSDYAYHIGEFDWGVGAVSNVNSDAAVATKNFFLGASVTSVIERMGPMVTITTSVTKDATTHTNTHKQIIDTADDIYVFLAADAAVLTLPDSYSSISDTDTSGHPSTYTLSSTGFYGTYVNTLGKNESMNMHFTNHAGTITYNNWGIELVYPYAGASKYLDITAGNRNKWGALITETVDEVTYDAIQANMTTSDNWPSDEELHSKMDGADVTLTVTRQGKVVYITAVHTPTSGDPFTLTYTLQPNSRFWDFESINLGVRIMTDASSVDYNYAVGKINTTVSSYGYATFSSVYPVNFAGTGLTPYIATSSDGSSVTLESVEGNIAANTGLMLKGAEGIYNIPVAATDGTTYNTESATKNYLFAVSSSYDLESSGTGTNYVLSVQDEKVVFAPINATSAPVRAGQAALWIPTAGSDARALNLTFADEVTGIDGVSSSKIQDSGEVYSLSGQRVSQPTRGLYIVGGKKFVIK